MRNSAVNEVTIFLGKLLIFLGPLTNFLGANYFWAKYFFLGHVLKWFGQVTISLGLSYYFIGPEINKPKINIKLLSKLRNFVSTPCVLSNICFVKLNCKTRSAFGNHQLVDVVKIYFSCL